MNSTHFWLIVLLGIAGIALIWRNKRQFDRTNDQGIQRYDSFWKKIAANSFDAFLLGLSYIGLSACVVLMLMIDPSLLPWLIVWGLIVYWLRVPRKNN
jgi:hypothetical protein